MFCRVNGTKWEFQSAAVNKAEALILASSGEEALACRAQQESCLTLRYDEICCNGISLVATKKTGAIAQLCLEAANSAQRSALPECPWTARYKPAAQG